MKGTLLMIGLLLFGTSAGKSQTSSNDWPEVGGTTEGQRYSAQQQISRSNVAKLQTAWVFHTHALDFASRSSKRFTFEATPVLWRRTLFISSPLADVFAVDAATGRQVWAYHPGEQISESYASTSRGVTLWHAKKAGPGVCGSDIVYTATGDRRLIALDAKTGVLCPRFGKAGVVDLLQGVLSTGPKSLSYSSPPIVVGDTVILGSIIPDNVAAFIASGAVRGFDAVTGAQKWSWEPLRANDGKTVYTTGSGNAWSLLAADVKNDLVFIPTGSASNDYFGGTREGDDRDADSLVALRASTGQKVWAYQLVHHDLWDYDTPSQPLLFMFRHKTPAVAVATKTSMVYVFNRLTGEPLYPIEERAVPQSTLPGEHSWPTQPFSTLPSLTPLSFTMGDIHLQDPADVKYCRELLANFDNFGLFTPPSERGSIQYPGPLGGVNWGSTSFDPVTGTLYARVSSVPYLIREFDAHRQRDVRDYFFRHVTANLPHRFRDPPPPLPSNLRTPDSGGVEAEDFASQYGAPYLLRRQGIEAPSGVPCGPTPFGSIVALSLDTGLKLWNVPHGQMVANEPGSIGTGGVISTAGGLVFAGASFDALIRAYDSATGKELWRAQLPAAANATPMTYTMDGRQFVVIAAGGGYYSGGQSDQVVAFALPVARHGRSKR